MRRCRWALVGLGSVLLLQSLGYAANPVQDSLRRLKERLKAAKVHSAPPKPAPAPNPRPAAPRPVRRNPRIVRPYRNTPSSAPRVSKMPSIKLPYKVNFLPHRTAGTIPKTGDIQVETVNKGRIVFVYFKLLQRSGPDGCATIPDVAPGNYEIMLKGPTLKLPWRRFVEVKPDQVTMVKVTL